MLQQSHTAIIMHVFVCACMHTFATQYSAAVHHVYTTLASPKYHVSAVCVQCESEKRNSWHSGAHTSGDSVGGNNLQPTQRCTMGAYFERMNACECGTFISVSFLRYVQCSFNLFLFLFIGAYCHRYGCCRCYCCCCNCLR